MSEFRIPDRERKVLESLGFEESYSDEESSKWRYPEPIYFDEGGEGWRLGRNYNAKNPNGKFWAGLPFNQEKPVEEFMKNYDTIRELPVARAFYKARDAETPLDEFETSVIEPKEDNEAIKKASGRGEPGPKPPIPQGVPTTISFDREQVETIKNTVAKGATDNELKMFIHLAEKYGLDPFAKEIFFTKIESKRYPGTYDTTIMTSRDGYLSIAQRDVNFDGLLSAVVRSGDVFKFKPADQTNPIEHEFGESRGEIIGAWAICYHKSRKPSIAFVDYGEYRKDSRTWKQYPSAMIQKVAEAFVLKRQFGISGLVTREEIGELATA